MLYTHLSIPSSTPCFLIIALDTRRHVIMHYVALMKSQKEIKRKMKRGLLTTSALSIPIPNAMVAHTY